TVESLKKYLHERIPISRAMGVEVVEATFDRVTLAAPLAPNINHRDTVFGGSASAVAMLAAWSLLHIRLRGEKIDGRIVIHKSAMRFERPILGNFTATTADIDPSAWRRFLSVLEQKGRARIKMASALRCNDENVAELEGDFVASGAQATPGGAR
ncbi:MAG: YiiD C-terminal domain-containing protein, partial [Thermodesulfobacteriota bacterium]